MTAAAADRPSVRPPPAGPPRDRSDTRSWAAVVAAIVLVGVIATWNSAHKSMWMDEAYSWYTAGLSMGQTIRRALRYELQPPLYFVLLNLWLRIQQSVMFGRALSAIAVMAFVGVMAGVGRRLGLRRWALVGVVTVIVPGFIWAAAELRGYGLTLLVAALTWYFFLAVTNTEREPTRLEEIGYVVAAGALLQCFYYGAFVLLGQWIAAGVGRRRWGRVTVLLAISGVALVSLIPTIKWQVASFHDRSARLDVLADPRFALWTTAATMLRAIGADAPILARPHAIAIALCLALLLPLARVTIGRRPWSDDERVVTVAALVPLLCIGALRLFNISTVLPRHVLVALPGLVVVMGLWLAAIGPSAARVAVGAALAASLVASLASFERSGLQLEDWRGAAVYVAAHADSSDVVLIYDPDRMLPFGYYYHGPARPYGIPIDIHLNAYTPSAYVIHDTAQIAARVDTTVGARRGVWLVIADRLLLPLQQGPALITGYMRSHRRLDPPVDFDGVRVTYAHAP